MSSNIKPYPNKTFKIGLTMAGAVSAGSYTAGVIDYLLETLELWEQAKQKNISLQNQHPSDYWQHPEYNPSVPMHQVQIEVMSGASAGGITGTLTAVSLLEGIQPINKDNPQKTNNKLYQSWVKMADEPDENTFSKLVDTSDIQANNVESLLNTKPIHQIAEYALNIKSIQALPNYIAPNLDLILTISNLRGIKYLINFQGKDAKSGTTITNHSGFFRYRFQNKNLQTGIPKNEEDLYFVLDLKGPDAEMHTNFLRSATLSTGAFPIGLKAQVNTIDKEYISRYTRYLFQREDGIEAILPDDGNPNFEFDSIDGGLINNEPFGYALQVLKEKCPEIDTQNNFAIVMVDPFPSYEDEEKKYSFKRDIFTIAKRMFSALRNQVMFKQDELINALDENNRTRFLIAPTRKDKAGQRVKNALACGALEGFSGFLKESFREHDFMLGRQNCQSFLRYYFAINSTEIEQKFGFPMPQAALERFQFNVPYQASPGEKVEHFFPIIPDMKVLRAVDNQYDTTTFGVDAEIAYPNFPSVSKKEIEDQYKTKITNRLYAIIFNLIQTKKLKFVLKLVWWFGGKKRLYKYIMNIVFDALKRQGLLKK